MLAMLTGEIVYFFLFFMFILLYIYIYIAAAAASERGERSIQGVLAAVMKPLAGFLLFFPLPVCICTLMPMCLCVSWRSHLVRDEEATSA